MPITKIQDADALHGASVRGSDGSTLGKIEAIYYDSRTRAPEWAAVKSGFRRRTGTNSLRGREGTVMTRPDRTPTRR
jgi:hypothetical protein